MLLKVGTLEHMKSITRGKIYGRYLSYYAHEKHVNMPYYDRNEGVVVLAHSNTARLKDESKCGRIFEFSKDNGLTGLVRIGARLDLPAFCLYAIHTSVYYVDDFDPVDFAQFQKTVQIHPEMRIFASEPFVCVLTDATEFRKRLDAALGKINITCCGRLVDYRDFFNTEQSRPFEYKKSRQILDF